MPSSYSTNLAFELIGNNEQAGQWGDTTNRNLGTLIEQAISGYVTQAISDNPASPTTLTMPNGSTAVARNMTIECTGTLTAGRDLIVPANRKLYFIFNNTVGGFAVTVKVTGLTGVSVPFGKKMILVCNGTDVFTATNYTVGNIVGDVTGNVFGNVTGNVTGNLTGNVTGNLVGNVTGNVTGNVSGTAANVTGVVAVANGGTAANNAATARVNLLPSYVGNNSRVLRLNSSATDTEWSAVNTGDVVGPASSSTNSLARYADTTGKLLTGSSITVTPQNNVIFSAPTSGYTQYLNTLNSQVGTITSDGTVAVYDGYIVGTVAYTGTGTAHTFALLTSNNSRLAISAQGNVSINAPASGMALAVDGGAAIYNAPTAASSGVLGTKLGLLDFVPYNSTDVYIGPSGTGGPSGSAGDLNLIPRSSIGVASAIRFYTAEGTPLERVSINSTGTTTFAAPSSGLSVAVIGGMQLTGTASIGAASSPGIFSYEYPSTRLYTGDGSGYSFAVSYKTGGVTYDLLKLEESTTGPGGPAIATFKADSVVKVGTLELGYRDVPQNAQTGAYTLALTDRGKHVSITTGGVVIPANASVAFPIGSVVTIYNDSGSDQAITITSDTLRLAGSSGTGARVLSQYGLATVIKVSSTVWVISGAGVL
jgi:hypothetical protein